MASSGSTRPPRKPRAQASLKVQAIGYLSRREHSRHELRAKLLAAIRKREREDATQAAAMAAHDAEVTRALRETPANGIDDAFAPRTAGRPGEGASTPVPARASATVSASVADAAIDRDPAAEVDTLLDWLEAHGYLSDPRFVESRVHARAARQGTARIKHELARHGLSLEPAQAASLRESEFARAQAIWQRKFGTPAADARERAKQARFLAGRGFGADVVWRVVGGEEEGEV